MPLTSEEKTYIIDKVVEILKSPEKEQLIAQLRQKVFAADKENNEAGQMDEVIYSVIQAIDELYG